jgi:hypothetical protein
MLDVKCLTKLEKCQEILQLCIQKYHLSIQYHGDKTKALNIQ